MGIAGAAGAMRTGDTCGELDFERDSLDSLSPKPTTHQSQLCIAKRMTVCALQRLVWPSQIFTFCVGLLSEASLYLLDSLLHSFVDVVTNDVERKLEVRYNTKTWLLVTSFNSN